MKLSQIDVHDNSYGVVFTAGTSVEADTCGLVNGTVRDNANSGLSFESVDEVSIVNVDIRGNGTGIDIQADCSAVRILGGSCSGNTTNVSDAGTSTVIQDVSGYKTNTTVTGTAAIDSTGLKTVVIAHGLPFTPSINDVQLTAHRNTNVGDWSLGYMHVVSVDVTNVTVQLRVLTASATGGAIITVKATIEGKKR